MTGITEAHWRCMICGRHIGPQNRVLIKEMGEWFHVADGFDQRLTDAQNRAYRAGDEELWDLGLSLHVCGPVEPELMKQRLISHLHEGHTELVKGERDDEDNAIVLEGCTLAWLNRFHWWTHKDWDGEVSDADAAHVWSYLPEAIRP